MDRHSLRDHLTYTEPMPLRRVWTVALAAAWLAASVALIYGLDCGRGFVKDDYSWLATSHLHGWDDVRRLFVEAPMGFYRPLVSISFGLNERLSGPNPLPYGLTNLAIAMAIAGMIASLVRRLGLPPGMALFAASVWIFNFHGINMAILWISGRTSLVATLWAVAAAWAFAGSRVVLAGTLVAMSLLSKEEPLLLPVIFAGWIAIDRRAAGVAPGPTLRAMVRATWPSVAALVAYLALRANTNAITQATAPDFYRLSAVAIGQNVLPYLDRSLTFPAALLSLGALTMRHREFRLTNLERSIAMKGAVWLALGFALTIMVPVRSSLYVCFPSVGAAMVAAAVGAAEWRVMRWRRAVVATLLVLPVALLPVYRARNSRLKEEARLASESLAVIERRLVDDRPARLVVYDDRTRRPSIADAFGDVLPAAVRLFVPSADATEILVLPADDPTSRLAEPGVVKLAMREGHLVDGTVR